MIAQRTLKTLTKAVGVGLHSGQRVELTLRPAPPDTGIVFRRVDLAEPVEIPVTATSVTDTRLASTISHGKAKVHTIEHVMSACAGLGIDNLVIDITAEEERAAGPARQLRDRELRQGQPGAQGLRPAGTGLVVRVGCRQQRWSRDVILRTGLACPAKM